MPWILCWMSAHHACSVMQPLAPCALSLEGTVLGASQITWVGGRTVVSAIASLSFFSLVSTKGWGLPGIWGGGHARRPYHPFRIEPL